jgi:bacillithiol system protein YtxJ
VTAPAPIPLADEAGLNAACGQAMAVIYKHSPHCGTSLGAVRQVRGFAEAHPGVPVYVVDVIRDRSLARAIAARLGVPHESPQVLLLRDGQVVWDTSHRGVTAEALAREAAVAGASGTDD